MAQAVREAPSAAVLNGALKAAFPTKGLRGPNIGVPVKGLKLPPSPGVSNFSASHNVRLCATL